MGECAVQSAVRFAWLSLVVLAPSMASAEIVETARTVDVVLRHGMALVTTRVVLENDSDRPAETAFFIETAPDAGLVGLRVCSANECRDGQPAAVTGIYEAARHGRNFSPRPVAMASITRGRFRRTRGISISAAPVVRGRTFEIEVRYIASTDEELGTVQLTLPAQVDEPAGPPAQITLTAPGLEEPTIDGASGPRVLEEATPCVVRARLPEGTARATAWSLRCGSSRCVRYRVAAGAVPPSARDVFLLLDVSGSAMEPEPELRESALRTLLAALSPSSRVVRVAYAREAQILDPTPLAPAEVPVPTELPWLGNRTLFESAWAAVRERVLAAHDPLLVIVGDGGIAGTVEANAALSELFDSGAQLSLVSLASRDESPPLLATVTRTLGQQINVTARDATEALRLLTAPVVDANIRIGAESLGPLRAGQARVVERVEYGGAVPPLTAFGRRIEAMPPRGTWATGVARRLDPDDVRAVLVAASPDQIEAAQKDRTAIFGAGLPLRMATRTARPIVCSWGCGCGITGSASREVLTRMRARMRPRIRQCFARARRGRPEWSARATLSVVFRYGELARAAVTQTTDPSLSACLVETADQLADIPFTHGGVLVNFPFYSESVPAQERSALPLAPHVDETLASIGIRGGAEAR